MQSMLCDSLLVQIATHEQRQSLTQLKRTHSHVDGLFTRCPTAPSICILLETQGILEDNTVILIARWSSSEPTWTV